MPIEQSGANATAEIQGNFNDIRGDQFNLVVYGNVTLPKGAHQRKSAENTLECTIRVIQEIASLVSIDTAKTVMTDIATILSLLQKHAKNKGSLSAATHNCKAICATLALATKGASMGRSSGSYGEALGLLQSSIDDLKSRLGDALRRGPMRRLFGASLDVKEINAWTAELGRISMSFGARLNMIPVITLEHIRELSQQSDIPNLTPDPPPPPPTIFFGREELVNKVKSVLLRNEHVALIGPGGIGKSTLAIALMNEEGIIEHCKRRFFVTYARMNPKTVTFTSFMDCISSVLGLPTSGMEDERQIKTNLDLCPALLVLDNAEVFEDAVDRNEATRISNFISHVADIPGVVVMLTSRTSSNARKVPWSQFDVPPLERKPARLSFRKIYHEEISDEDIDGLLATVDFHPLSISILAHTAKENRWSRKVLLDRWKTQQSKMLQMGDGKDNLAFTIGLSLDSPSIKALGDDVVHVLWIIAFFPQGINQDYLTRIFPSHSQILTILDTLCKVSLIYPSAPFLTMLAPIRLFLLDKYPDMPGLGLLGDFRCVYYRSMQAIIIKNESHTNLIISDHLNVEHLIAFDITHPPFHIQEITLVCRGFLHGLEQNKPRPTLLVPIISSLPEESALERDSKARCLYALGRLYFELPDLASAGTLYLAARILFASVGNHSMASLCTCSVALSYNNSGEFARSQQLLETFIRSPSWKDVHSASKMEFFFILDASRMHTSSEGVDSLFMRSMDDRFRGLQSRVRHWQARMYHGYDMPKEVQRRLEPLRDESMSSPNAWNRWGFLEVMVETEFMQRRFDAALDLLDQAHKSVDGHFRLGMIITAFKAAVASRQGDYDLSRSLSQHCIDTLGAVAAPTSTDFLTVLRIRGQNELCAGNYSTAFQLLTDAVANCEAQRDICIKASCIIAVGEAEIHLGHKRDSDRYFSQAVELCGKSGIPPALFGVCEPMLVLDDVRLSGWKRFLQTHL